MKKSLLNALAAALAALTLSALPLTANAEQFYFFGPMEGAGNVTDYGSGTNFVRFNAQLTTAPFSGYSRLVSDVTAASGSYEGGIGLYCPSGTQNRYVGGSQGQWRTGTTAGDLTTTCPWGNQATGFVYFDSWPND